MECCKHLVAETKDAKDNRLVKGFEARTRVRRDSCESTCGAISLHKRDERDDGVAKNELRLRYDSSDDDGY